MKKLKFFFFAQIKKIGKIEPLSDCMMETNSLKDELSEKLIMDQTNKQKFLFQI